MSRVPSIDLAQVKMERIARYRPFKSFNYSSVYKQGTKNVTALSTRSFTSRSFLQKDEKESDSTISSSSSSLSPVKKIPTASRPRIVDARSLAANRVAPNQANVIRAPVLRLKRGAIAARGRPGGATESSRGRGGGGGAAASKSRKARGERNPRRRRSNEAESEEGGRENELDAIFNEVRQASKPKTVRYTPVTYDMDALKDTWPSLPTGKTGSTGTIVERLNLASRRFGHGYVSPYELAKRLFEGERVFFNSDEERKAVMEEVDRMAVERADKLTQRKGDLVEPEDSSFAPIKADDRKALVGQLVRGQYEGWQKGSVRHPALDEVQRQLFNNETYRMTGKQAAFMGKFQSLLASAQRTKRASA